MTSAELKHQARLRDWAGAIRECRSSGQSVRQWCREKGITTTTYYRWERELLATADTVPTLPAIQAVSFTELPALKQSTRNLAEGSATLHIGKGSITFRDALSPELMKVIVEVLQSC